MDVKWFNFAHIMLDMGYSPVTILLQTRFIRVRKLMSFHEIMLLIVTSCLILHIQGLFTSSLSRWLRDNDLCFL
ncbi:Uncharacterized protein HZ326_10112 [Fusarium oxysporum f. sp. albedinis]|nr:Uncharacterized protein HZ326_10112 [Fusarium oxysporum f. sp. albedinis]